MSDIEISQLRTIAMSSQDLNGILVSDEVVALANRRIDPLVITKAFDGTIRVRVKRNQEGGAQADGQLLKQSGFKVEASADSKGRAEVTYVSEVPIVFAYEAARVNYVSQTLGAGEYKVTLEPLGP